LLENCASFIVVFLADRIAHSVIGCWHDDVVCLSVCLWCCELWCLGSVVGGWKLYCHGHFLFTP